MKKEKPASKEELARRLFEAYRDDMLMENVDFSQVVKTWDDAYDVQKLNVGMRREELQETIIGAKVGITTREGMLADNMDEPLFAPLWDTNLVMYREPIVLKAQPGFSYIEVEMAFKLTEDLSAEATADEIKDKCVIAVAVEMSTRRTKVFERTKGTVIDMGCSGKIFVSEQFYPIEDVAQLADYVGKEFFEGALVDERMSSNVLDNPINAVLFVNRKYNQLYGQLKKDMIIMSGAITKGQAVKTGKWNFEIVGLGEISIDLID